jgi:hypothetical protein
VNCSRVHLYLLSQELTSLHAFSVMEEAHRLVMQQVERRPLGVSLAGGSKYVEALMDKALSLHGALDRTAYEAS